MFVRDVCLAFFVIFFHIGRQRMLRDGRVPRRHRIALVTHNPQLLWRQRVVDHHEAVLQKRTRQSLQGLGRHPRGGADVGTFGNEKKQTKRKSCRVPFSQETRRGRRRDVSFTRTPSNDATFGQKKYQKARHYAHVTTTRRWWNMVPFFALLFTRARRWMCALHSETDFQNQLQITAWSPRLPSPSPPSLRLLTPPR